MSPFWNAEKWKAVQHEYCWDDELNEEIWSRSVAVQQFIQKPEELCEEGCLGAQQAMVDGQIALPWPPDLLGRDWSKPGGLLIIGSAYAGFIRELSGRPSSASMLRRDYDATLTWQEFKERFLRDVVINDAGYYSGLATLLANVLPVSSIATFDLCRASFVRRRRLVRGKGDEQGDKAVRAGRKFYWKYFEDLARPEPTEWIWRRIVSSRASAVVVLGRIAEHGFLRLAQRRGLTVKVVGEGSLRISSELNEGGWVAKYALKSIVSTSNPDVPKMFEEQKMKYWLKNGGRWYSVSGWADGLERFVLPIYHPSAFNKPKCDPQYRLTIPVHKRMLVTVPQPGPLCPAH